MKKLLIAGGVVVVVAAAGGWWAYSHLVRNPLKDAAALMAKGDVRAAQLILRTAVQNDPQNAEAHFRLGVAHLALGNVIAAEKELRSAQAHGYTGPDLIPALARAVLAQGRAADVLTQFTPTGLPPAQMASLLVVRGTALLSIGNAEAAQASAEQATTIAPTSAEAHLLAARVAQARGEPRWALAELNSALKDEPRSIQALLMKSALLRQTGDLQGAVQPLNELVGFSPSFADGRLARAALYIDLGQDDQAAADINAVLAKQPKNPLAVYSRALLQIRAKDWQAADGTLQTIDFALPQLSRGDYYVALVKANLNQNQQALDAIGRYTARVPADPDGWRLLARIDIAAGRKQEATEALARLDTQRPGGSRSGTGDGPGASSQALTELASLDLNKGDASGAEQHLDRSLTAPPTPAQVASAEVLRDLRAANIDGASKALDALLTVPNADPASVATLTAAVRLAQLRVDEARTALEKAEALQPDAVSVKIDLARVMMMQHQPDQASALLTPLLQKDPANASILSAYIRVMSEIDKPDKIIAALKGALAEKPGNPGLTMALAAQMARGGDYAGAYSLLDGLDPSVANSTLVQVGRARLLASQGRFKDAAAIYQDMLQASPKNLAVRRQAVGLLLAAKDTDDALNLAREGLKDAPGDGGLMQAITGGIYASKGIDAALAAADDLRKDPSNWPMARLLKGAVYMAAGKPDEAAKVLATEQADGPFSALVLARAGALRAAGQGDEAIKVLNDWVARGPDPNASDLLGAIAIEKGHLDEAAKQFEAVLAVRPNDPVALNNLAWVYQQQNNVAALPLARRAYLLGPNGQTADTLGWILVGQGQAKVASLLLAEAAADLPKDPSVHYHYAVALNDVGDRTRANAALAVALNSPMRFGEIELARQLQQKLAADASKP